MTVKKMVGDFAILYFNDLLLELEVQTSLFR